MAGFTNKALQSEQKIFQSIFGFDNVSLASHSYIMKNMVSVTFNDNQSVNNLLPAVGMEPKFFGCQADSLVTMLWEVKISHYVLFFNSQFHMPQAPLLHLPVSSDQAHPTAYFCLPLQQKVGLHKTPFPWHDAPSGHAHRSQAQQHDPVITEINLCAFQLQIWCHNCHPVIPPI